MQQLWKMGTCCAQLLEWTSADVDTAPSSSQPAPHQMVPYSKQRAIVSHDPQYTVAAFPSLHSLPQDGKRKYAYEAHARTEL
eukprot:3508694-Amphidinium_carterae.1